MSLHMVRTMFTDRDGRVILNKGTSNAEGHRVRPIASARAQRRRVRRQQEESQPEAQLEAQPEAQPADIDEPPQDGGYPGGPVDSFVLRTFGDHVATRLWDGVDRGELRVFNNGKKLKEDVIEHEEVEQLVKSSGLYSLLKCSYEMIEKGIISTFVERWHCDTNSFHLSVGEMTITLYDVLSLLHIPITGAFFNVSVFNKDEGVDILAELLGVSHGVAYVEFNVTRTAIISDKSAYAVSVAYLECFRDLNSCGGYAWGATAPAYLYDNLREANMHQTRTVSGYLALLQTWVYEHFPTLCRDCCRLSASYVEDYPRALKWKPKRDKGLVLPFRKALDEIDVDDICWTSYEEHRLKRPFEDVSLFRGWIRWSPKMYAHLPDKVLR
uniref:Protein MAIN-LIKE 1-like n=1 Tax=Cicer arietinum TaxID=3827 RepID=A0A3Q7Y8E7_CICAR|nr:protein MAIN-LIKE 1-like [Cicer arietinum]